LHFSIEFATSVRVCHVRRHHATPRGDELRLFKSTFECSLVHWDIEYGPNNADVRAPPEQRRSLFGVAVPDCIAIADAKSVRAAITDADASMPTFRWRMFRVPPSSALWLVVLHFAQCPLC
jgi:hypothetical protein